MTHPNHLFCLYLIFRQTCVNISQIKLLYIFLYLVNATIRILNNFSLWIQYSFLETNYYFWLSTVKESSMFLKQDFHCCRQTSFFKEIFYIKSVRRNSCNTSFVVIVGVLKKFFFLHFPSFKLGEALNSRCASLNAILLFKRLRKLEGQIRH